MISSRTNQNAGDPCRCWFTYRSIALFMMQRALRRLGLGDRGRRRAAAKMECCGALASTPFFVRNAGVTSAVLRR